MNQPDLTIEQFSEKVWASAYPDRRPWAELEQDTRDEWIRVMGIAWDLHATYPIRVEHPVRHLPPNY